MVPEDRALNDALKEVDRLRRKLQETETRLAFVVEVQKHHEKGMEAHRTGLSRASAPFASSYTELHLAYREAWLIGWKEQEHDAWLSNSSKLLQKALARLLMARKADIRLKKGKAKRKLEPKEIELELKSSWKNAREVLERINKHEANGQG